MEKKSQTIEGLMQGIDSLTRDYDWEADKTATSFVVLHGEGDTLHKMVGLGSEIAMSLANVMVYDEDARNIIIAAYQMYIKYEAEKLAPKIAPIIKQAESMLKGISNRSETPKSVSIEASFKPRLS